MSSITDHATGNSIAIFHFNKTYSESSASKSKESMEGTLDRLEADDRIPAKPPTLKATGKTDTINGWKAEEYVAQTASMKATYWIAKDLLKFHKALLENISTPLLDKVSSQFPDAKKFPGLPVLFILEQELPAGKIKTTIKTISVKETDVLDSEFSIPKGYKKQ
jgi:hypothetical protein